MAKYQVYVLPSAQKEIEKLPKAIQNKIFKALLVLADNPYPVGCKKLVGVDAWRFRVGDYRVVYSIENKVLQIEIIRVAHRKDVYR
ncbi:type II toxin-antitoxin system RelE/ParE family toxin [bacterium]|nr:type II toxin-antitoxin system RelE/ParE family toxin [bacterium]